MLFICWNSFLESFQRNKLPETNETLTKNSQVIQIYKRVFQIMSVKRYEIIEGNQRNKGNQNGLVWVKVRKINKISQVNQTN